MACSGGNIPPMQAVTSTVVWWNSGDTIVYILVLQRLCYLLGLFWTSVVVVFMVYCYPYYFLMLSLFPYVM